MPWLLVLRAVNCCWARRRRAPVQRINTLTVADRDRYLRSGVELGQGTDQIRGAVYDLFTVSELSAALRRRVDRVGRFFLLLALGLVGWVVCLSIKLPARQLAVYYDIAWVGFDSGLAFSLLLTGALMIKRSPHVVLPAAGTAALLLADAWFDVVTGRGGALVVGHRVRCSGGAAAGGPLRDRCPACDPPTDACPRAERANQILVARAQGPAGRCTLPTCTGTVDGMD